MRSQSTEVGPSRRGEVLREHGQKSRRVSRGSVTRNIISPNNFVSFSQNRIRDSILNTSVISNPSVSKSTVQGDNFNALPDNFISNMPVEAVKIASNSVCTKTRKTYKNLLKRFILYGNNFNCNVLDFNFSAVFLIGFLLSLYKSRGSIGSILMARASIKFYWTLSANSSLCPTDSEFVIKFFKGLAHDKKDFKPVVKAYPLNYTELEQLFFAVSQGISFPFLSFIKQRFIALLIVAYSSFARFEELQFLKIDNISLVGKAAVF